MQSPLIEINLGKRIWVLQKTGIKKVDKWKCKRRSNSNPGNNSNRNFHQTKSTIGSLISFT
jgi:hypothetical protein